MAALARSRAYVGNKLLMAPLPRPGAVKPHLPVPLTTCDVRHTVLNGCSDNSGRSVVAAASALVSAPPVARDAGLDTSVGKALKLLGAFEGPGGTVSLSALASRANLPKSTAHRLLAVLEASGYVQRRENGYCIGRRLFELGNLIPDARPRSLRSLAVPFLSELYEATHQTVHLAVLDGTEVVYLDKIYGHRSIDTPTCIGARVPATCTALGKAMLAYAPPHVLELVTRDGLPRRTPYSIVNQRVLMDALARTRDEGLSTDNEESRVGLSCVGVPVFDARSRQPIAAISVCGPSLQAPRVGQALRQAATALAAQLATSGLQFSTAEISA